MPKRDVSPSLEEKRLVHAPHKCSNQACNFVFFSSRFIFSISRVCTCLLIHKINCFEAWRRFVIISATHSSPILSLFTDVTLVTVHIEKLYCD